MKNKVQHQTRFYLSYFFNLIDRFFYNAKYDPYLGGDVGKFIDRLGGSRKIYFFIMGGVMIIPHSKIFLGAGWASGPFNITLFKTILKVLVVKTLKFLGMTAGFTYISIYTLYLDHFRMVSAAVEFFLTFLPTGVGRKIYLKSTRGGSKNLFLHYEKR